jgi:hypothetical protein
MSCSSRARLLCAKEFNPPFPFPPRGKPGRAGSPHAGSTLPASQNRWHAAMPPAPPTSKAPAWRGSIRERNWERSCDGTSWQTDMSAGSGSRPIPQWCC